MDYKSFFTTDNKSGWKTNELQISKKYPEVYNLIITHIHNNNLGDNLLFKEKV
jgi:hypothetical protein